MEQQRFTEREKKRLRASALKRILPHWASNADLAKGPKIFTRGEGCYVYDLDGNRYLDTFSSLITTACGHGRPEIRQAAMEQMEALEFFPNYHDCFTVPLIKLADKLAEIMPGDLEVCFFLNSGSEANETALKMARQYHASNGQPHRYKVIARRGSYHGTTLGATSYTGFPGLHKFTDPLLPGSLFAPQVKCHDCELGMKHPGCKLACLKAIEKLVEWEHPEMISAIIMDPLPGSNSGYPASPDGYLQGVRELCDRHGILLIFDEVQTGFGKTGKWFACEHWGVTPDIMSISKALTSGYLPLGVAVTTPKIARAFNRKPGAEFLSGGTFGGHPVSCAAALANIEIMEKEKLVERASRMGHYIKKQLATLRKHRIVGEIHGMGTLWALELTADRKTNAPLEMDAGTFVRDWCWEHNVILRNNRNILVMAPAIVITRKQVDHVVDLLHHAIPAAMKHFKL